MSLTLKNIGIGAEGNTGRLREPMASCWEEESRWARYDAVSDACWIYQDWDLEQNLRHLGWRQARRRTLSQGALRRVDEPRTRRSAPYERRPGDEVRQRRADHRLAESQGHDRS